MPSRKLWNDDRPSPVCLTTVATLAVPPHTERAA